MEIRWKTLLTKTLIWLAAEIILNCIGVDTLADYSEFVFDKDAIRRSLPLRDRSSQLAHCEANPEGIANNPLFLTNFGIFGLHRRIINIGLVSN